jgi:Beta-galactosidase
LILASGNLLSGAASADQLVLAQAVERNQSIEVFYRFETPVTGQGFLDIEWSDVDGRIVERRRILLDLTDAAAVAFPLDTRRAVTMKNQLAAHLSFDALAKRGGKFHRESDETRSFIVSPADHPWSDLQIIMWQGQTRAGYAALKGLGVTAGMVHPGGSSTRTAESIDPLLDIDMRWYVENIATDFYSPYHRWSGDRPKNWKFLDVKKRYRDNPLDPAAFVREPSLSDSKWLTKIQDRLMRIVSVQHPYRPLYYNLGDEAGVADLAAFWDFDFSEASLTAMRDWLKERYGSLTALNQEWAYVFARWEEVKPMTTREAMQRSDQNFAAWADFKEWMDVAFARAVESGTKAVHKADPNAVAAIEGAQIPGWGGYDYSRLATSVDAMELYDFGDNVEMVRSFNPGLIMLQTSVERGAVEEHGVWREALRGVSGFILWDENNEFASDDGTIGERGHWAAPVFAALRGGLGALLINSSRHTDPIGVLYSPASRRVQWLLDRRATGEDWSERDASAEYQDDVIRAATHNAVRLIEHNGLQHRFISSEELRHGELRSGNYRILMLPHSIALSPIEAKEISDFVDRGGVVAADGEPGIFDEHGRRAAEPLLSGVFAGPATLAETNFTFGKGKASYIAFQDQGGREGSRAFSDMLEAAGVRPRFPLVRTDGAPASDVETYIFENGGITVVGLLRDFVPSGDPTSREAVVMTLPHLLNAYDVWTGRRLGNTDRLTVELDPVKPLVLALSERPLTAPSISGPSNTRLGGNAEFQIRTDSAAAVDVVHLDVIDPAGNIVDHYSGNLLVPRGSVPKLLPLAFNDQPGVWSIRVRDLLGGGSEVAKLQVEP